MAFDFQNGNVFYNITGSNSVEVTYATEEYNSYTGNVTLPAKVTNNGITYNVTAIGKKAFFGSKTVTNVRIPSSVTFINEEAFKQCESLTTAYMAEPAELSENSFDFANVTLYVPELMKQGFLNEDFYHLFKAIVETADFDVPIGSQTLVISEIFFTGTTTPEGKQYSDDQYLKIGNNSNETLYLDGYAFAETAFLSVDKQDYTPDIMADTTTIGAIYLFPGNGHDYPIEPGEEVLVAVNAINHKEVNPKSFDLSKANFEFYDESENPNFQDSDNPDVTNMDNWYDYSASYWGMHNRGFKSYVLAKPEVKRDEYINNFKYTYTYVFTFNGNSYPMDGDGYKLPNSWIVDAVGLSVASEWQWNVLAPTLDSGWAHCGSVDHDKSRYNHSVIRKKNEEGKWIDTNNSTEDFISDAEPSMLSATTGIDSVRNDERKEMRIYRIDGVRVDSTGKPGLYIINGRKVLVK
ncbi:MAG: DUF4876 domain-containing protein [Prevotella sp.]|uniref:DUF4876 domain-containing protein n=1 Tax=Prevotella sp. TaxID=59823 RepID=UPI002A7F7985|nr:DUF4876 domain-containing protein [Prevotella sp.]MDY4019970.1 DUF4876 domain-containing protein [Prevotella sp.]